MIDKEFNDFIYLFYKLSQWWFPKCAMNSISPNLIQNIFDFGLEEIIQQIFLYLDHLDFKSLKNAKLTSTQGREFIGRRLWNSRYRNVFFLCWPFTGIEYSSGLTEGI